MAEGYRERGRNSLLLRWQEGADWRIDCRGLMSGFEITGRADGRHWVQSARLTH
jgi:hypothetical protein